MIEKEKREKDKQKHGNGVKREKSRDAKGLIKRRRGEKDLSSLSYDLIRRRNSHSYPEDEKRDQETCLLQDSYLTLIGKRLLRLVARRFIYF